jgi:hypothetical protein
LKLAYRDIRIVDRAIRAQYEAIQRLEFEISARICEDMKPKYAERIRAIVAATQKLAECAQQERNLRESLTDEGLTLTFEPLPFTKVGFSADEYVYANIYLRQAQEARYLGWDKYKEI